MSVSETSFTTRNGNAIRLRQFQGQYQAQPTWCWAATAASVHAFILTSVESLQNSRTKIHARPQCYFVDWQKGGRTCRARRFDVDCGFGLPGTERLNCHDLGCSIKDQVETGFPELALLDPSVGLHFQTDERCASFSLIQQEIDRGFPVIIRVQTGAMMHHIVTIIGYDPTIPAFTIWDPARGELAISVNALQKHYGRWTHTIFVRLPEDNV